MALGGTAASRTSEGAEWISTLTLRLKTVSDCKCVVSCLHALRAGRRQPKGRHRDLESRARAGWGSNRVDESSPDGQRCGRRLSGPCASAREPYGGHCCQQWYP
eukprot:839413-Amphidinium_carterae.1